MARGGGARRGAAAVVEALDGDAREQLYWTGVVATNQRNEWRSASSLIPV
jgi:hypothetical protein